jgi:putative endonuclease
MAWWRPFGKAERNGLPQRLRGPEKGIKSFLFSGPLRLCGNLSLFVAAKSRSAFSALSALKPSPASPTKALGNRGEHAACRFLKKAGMKILARNYRCPGGEIDIIALDPSTRRTRHAETIVFVEVKTRATETPAGPLSAIDAHKRSQVKKAAQYYLRHHPAKGYLTRYDAVAVIIPPGKKQEPAVRHIPNAF